MYQTVWRLSWKTLISDSNAAFTGGQSSLRRVVASLFQLLVRLKWTNRCYTFFFAARGKPGPFLISISTPVFLVFRFSTLFLLFPVSFFKRANPIPPTDHDDENLCSWFPLRPRPLNDWISAWKIACPCNFRLTLEQLFKYTRISCLQGIFTILLYHVGSLFCYYFSLLFVLLLDDLSRD